MSVQKGEEKQNNKGGQNQGGLQNGTGSPKGLRKQDKFLDSVSDSGQKQKLINQNIRLKTQIFELSRQLEQVMQKSNAKKKLSATRDNQDDEFTKSKKQQLKKQQIEVANLKTRINTIKKQLQSIYSSKNLIVKENQLRHLRNELQSLQQQKSNLIRIKKDQNRVLKILRSEDEYKSRIDELRVQLHIVKEQSKQINEKLMESERTLRKNHELYIIKQEKLKELQKKLQSKQSGKREQVKNEITNDMIKSLQEEISSLQKDKKQTQKQWQDKLNKLDQEIQEKKLEEEKKIRILKEREKQLRLIELKIKQFQKLAKHNKAMSNTKKSKVQDIDMKEFRHKRNIKYMNE